MEPPFIGSGNDAQQKKNPTTALVEGSRKLERENIGTKTSTYLDD